MLWNLPNRSNQTGKDGLILFRFTTATANYWLKPTESVSTSTSMWIKINCIDALTFTHKPSSLLQLFVLFIFRRLSRTARGKPPRFSRPIFAEIRHTVIYVLFFLSFSIRTADHWNKNIPRHLYIIPIFIYCHCSSYDNLFPFHRIRIQWAQPYSKVDSAEQWQTSNEYTEYGRRHERKKNLSERFSTQ